MRFEAVYFVFKVVFLGCASCYLGVASELEWSLGGLWVWPLGGNGLWVGMVFERGPWKWCLRVVIGSSLWEWSLLAVPWE